MLEAQVQVLSLWSQAAARMRVALRHARAERDRGEVTAQTAMIFLLVVAAIAAGIVVAARITSNANNIPEP